MEGCGVLSAVNLKKLIVYFALPLGVSMALIGCYVSGIRLLETLVSAPYLDAVHPNSRREFGLLENIQAALILAMSAIAFRTAYLCAVRHIRWFLYAVGAVSLLLFLEEIDYGMHFYTYLAGTSLEEAGQTHNLHNTGSATLRLKQLFDAITVGFFVLAPFFASRIPNANIRYLIPDRYIVLSVLAAFIARTVAHALDDRGLGYGLDGNIAEFKELGMYYVMFLWMCRLARNGPLQVVPEEEPETRSTLSTGS